MDKRKLRLILLGAVGVLILVIGIAAAGVYFGTDPEMAEIQKNYAKSYGYDKWADLPETKDDNLYVSKERFYELRPDLLRPNLEKKNAQFTKWIVTWIVKPIGLFAILVAALVVSRIIYNRIRPPSGRS